MFKRIPNQRKIGMTTTGLRNFKKVYTIKLVHTVQKKELEYVAGYGNMYSTLYIKDKILK